MDGTAVDATRDSSGGGYSHPSLRPPRSWAGEAPSAQCFLHSDRGLIFEPAARCP